MAPQTNIPTAANILGTIGTVFWCIQLVPQIWHNYKLKKTEGMPGSMMFLWALAAVPIGAYAVIQNFNIPLQIQPQMFGTLAFITWAQILIYHHEWSVKKAIGFTGGLFVIFAGVEITLIITLRVDILYAASKTVVADSGEGPYKRGLNWPVELAGIAGAVILSIGILPPYPEIWKRRGRVIGINWVFLCMDTLGAVFSLLALVVQNTFDVLGGSTYIVVIFLELGIYLSQIIWLLRTCKLRKQAKLEGKDFDDLPEARKYQYYSKKNVRRKPGPSDLERGNATVDIEQTVTPESTPPAIVADPTHKESG